MRYLLYDLGQSFWSCGRRKITQGGVQILTIIINLRQILFVKEYINFDGLNLTETIDGLINIMEAYGK